MMLEESKPRITQADLQGIPDFDFYRPVFSPWLGYGEFSAFYQEARPFTLVSADRCYILFSLALQSLHLDGHWYEAGVYKGGTAAMLTKILNEKGGTKQKELHLFDSFEGMPETAGIDLVQKGNFNDTSLEEVESRIDSAAPNFRKVSFHKGFVPLTFRGLESHRISFANIDVDIYQAVKDCCDFIYPRLQNGGIMVFDDYGFQTCPGARKAVDEFFLNKHEVPLILPTGQAVVIRVRLDSVTN